MADDKPTMTPDERDALLHRIAFTLDVAANEGKNHGKALEQVRGEIAAVKARVESLEKKSDPTMSADASSEIQVDASAFDALPPYRPPVESLTEEDIQRASPKQSLRVAALNSKIAAKETLAQTPMLEEQTSILKGLARGAEKSNLTQGILMAVGIILASYTSTLVNSCNAAHYAPSQRPSQGSTLPSRAPEPTMNPSGPAGAR